MGMQWEAGGAQWEVGGARRADPHASSAHSRSRRRCVGGFLFYAHLFACLLVLQTAFLHSRAGTWLEAFGYCECEANSALVPPGGVQPLHRGGAGVDEKYLDG